MCCQQTNPIGVQWIHRRSKFVKIPYFFSEDFVSYLGNNVQKTRKNSNFRTAKNRENISRPRFYGYFFFIATSQKKKIFLCVPQGYLSPRKKKQYPQKKIFVPLPPNIEEYVLQINQSDRCLEDTQTINISQNTILFSEDFVSYLGNNV